MMDETSAITMPLLRPSRIHGRRAARELSRRRKVWVPLLFLALRGADALIYLASPVMDRREMLAILIVGALWTTAALGGVWRAKNWCRFALNILIVASTGFSLFFIRGSFSQPFDYPILGMAACALVLNALVIWAVASLPELRRSSSMA
jgi:hypothetical protein